MSRLTRDGTAEPVSRDHILRRERGQGNIHFTCSADHEQDRWQPYPVDPSLVIRDYHSIYYIYYTLYILHTMLTDASKLVRRVSHLLVLEFSVQKREGYTYYQIRTSSTPSQSGVKASAECRTPVQKKKKSFVVSDYVDDS